MNYEDLAELVANVSPDVLEQMKKNSDILKAIRAGFDVPGGKGANVLATTKQSSTSKKALTSKYHAEQTEDDFQQQCIDLLHLKGWTVAHSRKARTQKGWVTPVQADGKGFPDLVAVRDRPNLLGHTVMFIEVKAEKGKLTPEQKFWGNLLLHAKADWSTWYPSKWEQIVREVE